MAPDACESVPLLFLPSDDNLEARSIRGNSLGLRIVVGHFPDELTGQLKLQVLSRR
jgi:hypothetical protein